MGKSSRGSQRHPRTGDRPRRLYVEHLEHRAMLAAAGLLPKAPLPAWFARAASARTATAATTASTEVRQANSSNEWIVQLNDTALKTIGTVTQAANRLANPALGLQVVKGLGLPGQLLVTASGAATAVTSFLTSNPLVRSAEPNRTIALPAKVPNDPRFTSGELWGLNNTGQSGGKADADIDAPEAWEITTGSDSVVVAVIDTGIQFDHPDLQDNMWKNPGETPGDGIDNDSNGFVDDVYGWDFANDDATVYDSVDDDHGTHCAGTIAGRGNNGTGVVGVAWNTKIMSLKFLDPFGFTDDAIAAVNYATMMRTQFGVNLRVTSNSWGGGGFSQGLKDAIDAGGNAGILFVAAAGNDGTNNDAIPQYPASYDSACIVSVAATDRRDALAWFSCFGSTSVDLSAPGVAIVSTVPSSSYASYDGTSMATPHVSGVAALAVAVDPTLSVTQLKQALLDSTDKIPSLAGKTVTGGRLNALNTLEFVQPSLKLLSVTPSGGVDAPVTRIVATFSEKVHPDALKAANFVVVGDGLDGKFGTADDAPVAFADANVVQAPDGVVTITLPAPLTVTERYLLTLKGTGPNPLRNLKGRALEQRGSAPTGQDLTRPFFVRAFVEPNEVITKAAATPAGAAIVAHEGMIGDGPQTLRDVDLYKVSLAAGQSLVADINARSLPVASRLDSMLRVFSSTGTQLATNDDDLGSLDSFIRFIAPAAGDYYVGVSGFGNAGYLPVQEGSGTVGSMGEYQLVLTFGEVAASLSADIVDVTPDPRTTAVGRIDVSFNRSVTGFDLTDLTLTRNGAPVSLAGASLTPSPDRRTWTLSGSALEQATAANAANTYRLLLRAASSGILDASGLPLTGDASDEWTTSAPPPPPTPPGPADAGDTISAATALVPGATGGEGVIGDGSNRARDVDIYAVSLTAGQTLVIDIDAQTRTPRSTLDSVVRVFDASGRLLAANDNDTRPGNTSRDSYLEFRASQGSTFFVSVSGFGNAGYNPTVVGADRRAGSVGAYILKMTVRSDSLSQVAALQAAAAQATFAMAMDKTIPSGTAKKK